ncbi:MAG: pirin-like C-terminal cupin domain-containing protein [Oligoflexales bacterium]
MECNFGLESSLSLSTQIKSITTVLLIVRGNLEINRDKFAEQNVVIFEQKGQELSFNLSSDFKGLLLNGEPIGEPAVAYGPFVIDTEQEIMGAINDYRNGKMGKL